MNIPLELGGPISNFLLGVALGGGDPVKMAKEMISQATEPGDFIVKAEIVPFHAPEEQAEEIHEEIKT